MDANEKQRFMFTQLVLMFHSATMHQLGKMKNPITGTIDRDLPAAQNSIDILDMLKEKTRGNLSDNESRLLSTIIQELKLNFVDEANKKAEPETQGPAPAGGSTPSAGSPPPGSAATPEGEKPQ